MAKRNVKLNTIIWRIMAKLSSWLAVPEKVLIPDDRAQLFDLGQPGWRCWREWFTEPGRSRPEKVQLTADVERGHILLALINKTWLTEILWLSRRHHEAINHRLLPALGRVRIRVCKLFCIKYLWNSRRKPLRETTENGQSVKLIRLGSVWQKKQKSFKWLKVTTRGDS